MPLHKHLYAFFESANIQYRNMYGTFYGIKKTGLKQTLIGHTFNVTS